MLVSTSAIEGAASQLSVAIGVAAVGMLSQLAAVVAGTPDNTGASVSVTVIIWVPGKLLFPAKSVAVQVRVMI